MASVLAIDVGGTNFRLGLFDTEGRRLSSSENATDASSGLDWMLQQLKERGRRLLGESQDRVAACGIAFGGPVDFERQRVNSVHVPGWADFELARWAENTFEVPAQLDNDANAGGLGEYRFGSGQGKSSLVYVTISTGVGAGIILDGQLWRGKDGLAGEIGHLPVTDAETACECGGHGCLESVASGRAVALRAQSLARRVPEALPRVIELNGGEIANITCETVFKAAEEGEQGAVFIVHEAARWLAHGLMAITRILNPECIILGGGVAQAGEGLLRPVRRALQDLSSPMIRSTTQIDLAKLGNLSPLYGAAAIGLDIIASQRGDTK